MRRLWATSRTPEVPPRGRGDRITLVCATDGRTHRTTEIAYGEALAARTGTCPALCGHMVVLCALATPPGPPCPDCTPALR